MLTNYPMSTDRPGLRILLIDDSDDDRLLFTVAFGKSGIAGDIIEKEDGNEAIEFLKRIAERPHTERPDAVFLDLKMPGRNGFEVLEWVQDQPDLRTLTIFILSGSNEPSDIQRARELGAAGYMVKPIKSEKFRELFAHPPAGIEAID